jgi:N-acetylneuraminate synthase
MKNHAFHTYIIAEAGVNHNGDETLARHLIDIAVQSRADAVKFQLFDPEALTTSSAPLAQYQSTNLQTNNISQQEMLRRLALPPEAFVRLAQYCESKSIDFLCTPFDEESLRFLVANIQMRYLKFSSGDLTNGPLLLAAARSGLPLILSTGMASLPEIKLALAIVYYGYRHPKGTPSLRRLQLLTPRMLAFLCDKVTLLHCVSQYPAPLEAANLLAMDTLREAFNLPVGLSDHTEGMVAPVAAAARGAVMLEKHFTYSTQAQGPDHKASLSPVELQTMVMAVRGVERAMGSPKKECLPIEENTRAVARKTLVAKRLIQQGEVFSEENVVAKRPADGPLLPNAFFVIAGRKAKRSYVADEFIAAEEAK